MVGRKEESAHAPILWWCVKVCFSFSRSSSVVTPSLFVAGTDGRFFRARGVPSYGLVPCILTAEELKGYHGIDERLSLENLTLGTKIILDLTARLATP